MHDSFGFMRAFGIAGPRRLGTVLATTALLSLTACGNDAAKAKIACFPKESQKWIWQAGKIDNAAKAEANASYSHPVAAKMATIYVDRSASMVGYINGADNDNRPFQILLGNLPTVAKIAGTASQFRAFGLNISEPIAVDDAKAMQSASYYACTPGTAGACESSESHLDQVFAMVAAQKDEMAIVVTDLWYDNALDGTGGPSALQEPLTDILASGRSVAVYGIEAPFKGKIYDIPAGGTAETMITHAGTHPLFVVVIGSKNDVMELDRQMERSGARTIREGLQSGAIKRSVFTTDPGPLRPTNAKPVDVGTDPDVRVRPFETYPGMKIQQFAMLLDNPRKPPAAKVKQAQWVAPKPADFLPNTVWQGDLRANVRVWQRIGDDVCGQWIDNGNLVEDGELSPGNGGGVGGTAGQFTLSLSKAELSRKIRRPGVYLLSGQLQRVSVDSPNAANAWANDWTFAPNEAGAVLSNRRALFPTLNLNEVMRIMENALRTATERANEKDGGGIVGFTVMVKAED